MEDFDVKLKEVIAFLPHLSSNLQHIEETMENNNHLGGIIDVRKFVTTTIHDQDNENGNIDEPYIQPLRTYEKNLNVDISSRLHQTDPALVVMAAAAAAVKFRSNYLPPIGVFWDIENCQVEF
jgi:hypothetical protein